MVFGDSVMHDASYGITAALGATGEATVATRTIDGFGLVRASNWPTSLPNLIHQTQAQIVVASWSWDQYGPTTPNALHQPAQYTALLRRAVATMLTPGNGVEGVIFTQFPESGNIPAANQADYVAYNKARWAGVIAWNNIAKKMTTYFPGRVMYFPIASSVMLDGDRYSAWLPTRERSARAEGSMDPGPQAGQRPSLSRGQRSLRRCPVGRHDRRLQAGAGPG